MQRLIRHFDIDGKELEPTYVEVSEEEVAEEAERQAMEKAEDLIDGISNLADAKVFLKRLVKRLINKGLLP